MAEELICSACGCELDVEAVGGTHAIPHGARLYCPECAQLILSPEELSTGGRAKPPAPALAQPPQGVNTGARPRKVIAAVRRSEGAEIVEEFSISTGPQPPVEPPTAAAAPPPASAQSRFLACPPPQSPAAAPVRAAQAAPTPPSPPPAPAAPAKPAAQQPSRAQGRSGRRKAGQPPGWPGGNLPPAPAPAMAPPPAPAAPPPPAAPERRDGPRLPSELLEEVEELAELEEMPAEGAGAEAELDPLGGPDDTDDPLGGFDPAAATAPVLYTASPDAGGGQEEGDNDVRPSKRGSRFPSNRTSPARARPSARARAAAAPLQDDNPDSVELTEASEEQTAPQGRKSARGAARASNRTASKAGRSDERAPSKRGSDTRQGMSTGMIIGIAAGALVLLALLGFALSGDDDDDKKKPATSSTVDEGEKTPLPALLKLAEENEAQRNISKSVCEKPFNHGEAA